MITISAIQVAVCRHYRLPRIEMVSDRRSRDVSRPRQVAMYLAKRLTPQSLPNIGKHFGGRDHTTVRHAVIEVGKRISADHEYAKMIRRLTQRIKRAQTPVMPIEQAPIRSDLWLTVDLIALRQMAAAGGSAKDISDKLGRSASSIRSKASRLGIKMRHSSAGQSRNRDEQEQNAYTKNAISGSALLRDAILRLAA